MVDNCSDPSFFYLFFFSFPLFLQITNFPDFLNSLSLILCLSRLDKNRPIFFLMFLQTIIIEIRRESVKENNVQAFGMR